MNRQASSRAESMSLRDRVVSGVSTRADFPLIPQRCALLVIDIQTYLSTRKLENEEELEYYTKEAFPRAVSNIRKLAQAFRVLRDDPDAMAASPPVATGCEVIFTYLQAATNDGRDISLDYKLSGPILADIPRVDCSQDELFLPDLRPDQTSGKGDILLPKTSCSVFQSTNLDYLLRNLRVEQIVVAGQLTNQCVESAVRDAADCGYFVTVAEDACAANSASSHMKGLDGMKGFCRILDTAQVIDELVDTVAHELMDEKERKERKENGDAIKLDDEMVIKYLRDKGMNDEAETFSNQFRYRKTNAL